MKVRFSREARADLRAIARWIGTDNLERAYTYSAELRAACSALAVHPARFPVVTELDGHVVRKRVLDPYLIFYRIRPSDVEIIGIIHGARDWIALIDGRRKLSR